MATRALTIGELARQTGLTVRTLHYYDEIGLLKPSHHSAVGHRRYDGAAIARLQQIVALRQLGLSLGEIEQWLARPSLAPGELIAVQLEQLRQRITQQQQLHEQLVALARLTQSARIDSMELLLDIIKGMNSMEKYYTPEQLAELKARAEQVGPERIRQVEAEWPALIAEVRAELERGTDPADPRAQALGQRWQALIDEFTGGNPGIAQSLQTMYEQEPGMRQMAGGDDALFAYVGQIMAAARR